MRDEFQDRRQLVLRVIFSELELVDRMGFVSLPEENIVSEHAEPTTIHSRTQVELLGVVGVADNFTSSEKKSLLAEILRLKKLLSRLSRATLAETPSSSLGVGAEGPGFRAVAAENNARNIQCEWSPSASTECEKMICSRLRDMKNGTQTPKRHGRWIFLGDSTMSRLYKKNPPHVPPARACPSQYNCKQHQGGRCNEGLFLGANPKDFRWTGPDLLGRGEGPVLFGLKHPDCKDCSGCYSEFLVCHEKLSQSLSIARNRSQSLAIACEKGKMDSIRYGGYFAVEFARDVELQSPEFGTTQEIMAAYLKRQYNKEALVKDFGLPICILTAGIHDMKIPNITTSKFLVNVNWYLDVLKPECSLSSTRRRRQMISVKKMGRRRNGIME